MRRRTRKIYVASSTCFHRGRVRGRRMRPRFARSMGVSPMFICLALIGRPTDVA